MVSYKTLLFYSGCAVRGWGGKLLITLYVHNTIFLLMLFNMGGGGAPDVNLWTPEVASASSTIMWN